MQRHVQSWLCVKRNTSSCEENDTNTETEIETDIRNEAMGTRVALHPFLAGMNRKHVALLTDCAISAHFSKGQVILREEDQASRFYLIESGKVIIESGKVYGQPVIIDTIGAGDLLGWSWMFSPYTWQFTARASKPTTAIFFYGTICGRYRERDHSLGYELLKRMAAVMTRRLQAARQKMSICVQVTSPLNQS